MMTKDEFEEKKIEVIKKLHRLVPLIEETIAAQEDVPYIKEGCYLTIMGPGSLRIDIPWNIEIVKGYLATIFKTGRWDRESVHNNPPYHVWHMFRHKTYTNITLQVVIRIDAEGSTCELVQVGERTVPVYEAKCPPGGQIADLSDALGVCVEAQDLEVNGPAQEVKNDQPA